MFVPASRGVTETGVFHKISGEGPIATFYNDGETVYVNASDGVSSGGSVTYYVIDEKGGNYSLDMWDNGNQADTTANDGFYTARFTIYNNTIPGVPYSKVQLDPNENFTVIIDLDGAGDWTYHTCTSFYTNFTVWIVDAYESSDNLYFDNDSKTLYYSNDQGMSDNITIVLRDNKQGAFGKVCSGGTAFGDSPIDTYYDDRQWDLNYTIDTNETHNGTIMFTVRDRANYEAYTNITCVLDNDPPDVDNLAIANLPDHIGATYRWWQPSGLAGGLNATWTNVDLVSRLGWGDIYWNASVDAYDQTVDCGVDGWEVVTDLDDDGSCMIDITVTIYDNVGNPGNDTLTIMFDQTAPNFLFINVSETSDHIYYNGTLLYSNDQAMSDTFTFLVIDEESGSGRQQAVGSAAFGNAPSDADYSDGRWDLPYTIDTAESSGPITIFIHDNVGNWNSAVVNTLLDNDAPVLDAYVSENSSYLYYHDGTLYFGDDMPSNQSALFNGTANDAVGLQMVLFSQEGNLIASPSSPLLLNGTTSAWNGTYIFDSSSTQGDGTIDIDLVDLVGNTDRFSQAYIRDIKAPNIILDNFADGDIIRDNDPMLSYAPSPWEVLVSALVSDDHTTLHRVDIHVDGGAPTTFIEPAEGLFNLSSPVLNGTGWHSIVWRAWDHLNNMRILDSSILRSPNSTTDPFRKKVNGDPTIVNAALDTTYGATLIAYPSSQVWGSVMRYPVNPVTLDPAMNYTDPNRNYTTFHYLDVGVNNTAYGPNMTVRIYFTQFEIDQLSLDDAGIVGIARWNGTDWHWITSSNVSTASVIVGGIGYSGYTEVTIDNLYNSTNVICVAGWTYRLTIQDSMCTRNRTIFRNSVSNNYRQEYTIAFRNIGTSSENFWVNASGPADWVISWNRTVPSRVTISSIDPWQNCSLTLYVSIPESATNVSSGFADEGKAYPITIDIESFTDSWSTLNPWRSDQIVVTGFIRRTDLTISSILSNRIEYITGDNMTIWVAVENFGNYTQGNATVDLYMTIDDGIETHMGSVEITPGDLEPLETGWAVFVLPPPPKGDIEFTFRATLTYGGDDIPGGDQLTEYIDSNKQPHSASSTGIPSFAPLLFAVVLTLLYLLRRRG